MIEPMRLDPRIVFYLENKRQIEEWVSLAKEVSQHADSFFRSLAEPLETLVGDLGHEVRVEASLEEPWPKIRLLRESWRDPETRQPGAAVALEWKRAGAAFDRGCTGVVCSKVHYAQICAILDRTSRAEGEKRWQDWPTYRYEPPHRDDYWNDLPGLRSSLVERVIQRWHQLSPVIDEAFAMVRSREGGM